MDKRKKARTDPPYEETEVSAGKSIKIIMALICFGIAILTIYLSMATPQAHTVMANLKDVIRGIAGHMTILLSIMLGWIGILCIGSAKGKRVNAFHVVTYMLMFLSIFAAVHVFSAKEIIQKEMTADSYGIFIAQSFKEQIGGGVLGAFISYYLHHALGEIGGFGACILLIAISLVATGKAAQMLRWGKKQAENRENRHEQPQRGIANGRSEEIRDGNRPGGRRKTESDTETAQQKAARRQSGKQVRIVTEGGRDSVYIPENRAERPAQRAKKKAESAQASESKRKAPDRGIDTPKPLREIKKGMNGKKTSAKAANAADDTLFIPDADIADESSVSAEAMSVVAREMRKTKKQSPSPSSPSYEDDPANEQDVEEIFTVEKEEKKQERFETIGLKPRSRKEEQNGEADPNEVIAREPKKVKRGSGFVETEDPDYNYPPIDLLNRGDKDDSVRQNEEADRQKADKLIATLKSFGINTRLTGIAHGPAVTRYELQPEAGIKVSRITSLSDDIALALAAESVRIEAPIPGKAAVGVEIPNEKIETVHIRDVLESNEAMHNSSKIAVALGKDNSGRYVVADIAKMPHVLIAGQTGSGKSVCINSIITSILYRATPEDVRMILIDPKVVELQVYNEIPHLIAPVVTDPKKASSALQWAVSEMLGRYKKFSAKGVRNITGYNAALKNDEQKMPQIVIIIDELADLMMAAPGEVEDSICRIAQLARAAGMHLVIATQRPSVNVVTGIIKANIPTRIAFAVASQTDSRVMIDHGGAEKLLGYGDMLFVPNGGKTLRVQGTWVSDEEVNDVVNYIRERCDTNYDEDVQEKIENSVKSDAEIEDANSEMDDRLAEAVEIVVEAGQASVSMLQRRMRVGYSRAGRLIDEMEKRGIVSEADGAKPRNVLMTREQFKQMFGEDI